MSYQWAPQIGDLKGKRDEIQLLTNTQILNIDIIYHSTKKDLALTVWKLRQGFVTKFRETNIYLKNDLTKIFLGVIFQFCNQKGRPVLGSNVEISTFKLFTLTKYLCKYKAYVSDVSEIYHIQSYLLY